MSKPLTNFIKEKYAQFRQDLFSSWGIDKQHFDQFESQLKLIHKRYLSLACAATVIGYRANRSEYVHGVVEASYLSLILILRGLENPTCVLLRQSIELVLKHIYFSTHPIEYEWACSREGYRDLTFQALLEYITRTNERQKFDPSNDICVKLNDWFGALSRHVHVHSKAFMGYKSSKSVFQPTSDIIKKFNERTNEIWSLLTTLLITYFPERYFRASSIEKQLMRNVLPINLRKKLDQYLANYP